jgi:hypothetical protein
VALQTRVKILLTQEHSLFDLAAPPAENLAGINAELLRRAKALPQCANQVFILGEGRAGVKLASVGESPGPPASMWRTL